MYYIPLLFAVAGLLRESKAEVAGLKLADGTNGYGMDVAVAARARRRIGTEALNGGRIVENKNRTSNIFIDTHY